MVLGKIWASAVLVGTLLMLFFALKNWKQNEA